jgi:hypothetical protein
MNILVSLGTWLKLGFVSKADVFNLMFAMFCRIFYMLVTQLYLYDGVKWNKFVVNKMSL